MTALRSFQAEIEQFSQERQRQAIREAREAHAAAEAAKHHHKVKQHDVVVNVVEDRDADAVSAENISVEEALFDADDEAFKSRLVSKLLQDHGEYIVALGAHSITEEGEVKGTPITKEQLDKAVERLRTTCEAIKAEMTELYRNDAKDGPFGTWLVRLKPASVEEVQEVRVAVVGNVDAGKSTILGVLTRGGLDDGRGKARVALFKHPHEVETGRTSSIGGEILGFTTEGKPIYPSTPAIADSVKREKLAWDEIYKRAAKVVSFIDLAGHERYFKTTVFGLSGHAPDYVMLIVGGNAGLIGMSKEHLGVALALNVPIIVCVTKTDMTPPNIMEQTVSMLKRVLQSPGCRKTPVFVENEQQAIDCALDMTRNRGSKICPVFMLSNVTGDNLPNLRSFLNILPSSQNNEKYVTDAPFELHISDAFSVPFIGTVVSGVIESGVVKPNDQVLVGPDSLGHFIPTAIRSIEKKRVKVDSAEAGQCVALALKRIRRSQVRKGMVLMAKTEIHPKAVKRFEGMVMVLHHSSTIQPRYTAMLHCGAVRASTQIVSLDHSSGLIRTGDRAKVVFEFIGQAEFVKEGQLILLREAKTKVLGVVTKVLD